MIASTIRSVWLSIPSAVLGLAFVGALPQSTSLANSDLHANKSAYKRPAEIPFPANNLYSPEKAALGKALFFDPRLSGAENMTCASCHNPSFGWEIPVKTAVGALNVRLSRQAPSVENMAWVPHYFWDGRAPTLEAQARGPIEAQEEMNLPLDEAVARLNEVSGYRKWFRKVFSNEGVTGEGILKALATYQRTIMSGTAPFDEWVEGREDAISESAKRGFQIFNGKARCADCHSGWRFTDDLFHDIGVATDDVGRGAIDPGDTSAKFAFKTPGLRDISLRAPYMHNGEVETLEDVIIHYIGGGIERPSRSPLLGAIDLEQSEVDDLVAFLESLTASQAAVELPILPK